MDVQGKIKAICPPEQLKFKDGRTYTQQLVILDCGEYSRGGDFYENDLPFYFGEKHLSKLTAVAIGAQVCVVWHQGTRLHLHRQDGRQDTTQWLQRAPQRLRHQTHRASRTGSTSAAPTNGTTLRATSTDASTHGTSTTAASRASLSIPTDASATSAAGGHR